MKGPAVVIHLSGVSRVVAPEAAVHLDMAGFTGVMAFRGGIATWKRQRLLLEASERTRRVRSGSGS